MVNSVTLIGNLGQDPELRTTGGGTAVCTLSLATNERRKDGDGWKDHVEWHKITCFGKTAENVAKYCQKGKQLYIQGRIQTRKWQDKEGKDRYTTEIVANEVKFLGGGNGNSGGQRDSQQPREQRQGAPKSQPQSENNPFNEGDGGSGEPAWDKDDIPFSWLLPMLLPLAAFAGVAQWV